MCKCHKCPCKFSILVNVFYFTQGVYCVETIIFELLGPLQTRDINNVTKSAIRIFFFLAEKKNKKSSVRVCGRAFFV